MPRTTPHPVASGKTGAAHNIGAEVKAPINEVLAANLRHFMQERAYTQAALGERAGVAQRTIGNYLNPALRQAESKTGKAPSAKLTELEKIAQALQVEVWELLRPITPAERVFYRQIEESFAQLRKIAAQPPEPPPDRNTHREALTR